MLILSLCFSLFSGIVVQAQLADGQVMSGELKSVSTQQLVLDVNGQTRTVDAQLVQDVAFAAKAGEPSAVGGVVTLTDGSVCRVQSLQVDKEGQAVLKGLVGTPARCSVAAISSVQLFSFGDPTLAKQWEEILGNRGSEDFLVVNKNGNLDYLAGVIGALDQELLNFVYGGSRLEVPAGRVAGLVFAKRPPSEINPLAIVTTVHGSVWRVRELVLAEENLQWTSVSGASQSVPLAKLQSIEFVRSGVVYLTDLAPESTDYRSYYPSKVLAKRMETLAAPRRDVSFTGGTIQVVGEDGERRAFEKGLAVQSRTEISYRLAKKYQRFQATVGLDPDAAPQGDLRLQLFADDEAIFEQSIAKDDAAVPLDVSVAGANRLKILVDFGKNLDIGDRLHLAGAKLIQ